MVDKTVQSKGQGHTISVFEFTNQDNQTIQAKDVHGKIWVAEYFFTTCKSICPIMNQEMNRVQKAFKNDAGVKILSFTVDPDTDTPSQLKKYASKHPYIQGQWHFLTGKKEDLYRFARESIFVLNPAEAENQGDAGSDFIHTNNFVLIDYQGRIRGYYNGTLSKEVSQLIDDINVLKDEQKKFN
jgi:protein SCO1/2